MTTRIGLSFAILALLLTGFFGTGQLAFAQAFPNPNTTNDQTPNPNPNTTNDQTPNPNPNTTNDQTPNPEGLINPLKADSVIELILQIIDILLVFALPIIILFIMYGGYLLVTAQGEPGKITQGRNAILWALIGGVIVLGAEIILAVIENTVDALK